MRTLGLLLVLSVALGDLSQGAKADGVATIAIDPDAGTYEIVQYSDEDGSARSFFRRLKHKLRRGAHRFRHIAENGLQRFGGTIDNTIKNGLSSITSGGGLLSAFTGGKHGGGGGGLVSSVTSGGGLVSAISGGERRRHRRFRRNRDSFRDY